MNRKQGQLVQTEKDILATALRLLRDGSNDFYGLQLTEELQADTGSRFKMAFGTLYRALDRLEGMGMLASTWEDPQSALDEGRPRRRFYRLKGSPEAVERTLAEYEAEQRRKAAAKVGQLRPVGA